MRFVSIQNACAVAVLSLFIASGCAPLQTPRPMSPEELEQFKTKLGTVGVTSARYVPRVEVQVPSKGAMEGVKDGAQVGALVPLEISVGAMQGCSDPYCLLLPVAGLALAPVGAVVGGIGGSLTADRPEAVTEREVTIKGTFSKLHMQERMYDRFLYQLAGLSTFPTRSVPGAGPSAEGASPDYRQLKLSGIDTINEVDVQKLTLTGYGKVKPELAVHLDVKLRLVSTADNTEQYSKVYQCLSRYDKFEKWAEEGAKKFREEIEGCYDDIAVRAIHDVYLRDTAEHPRQEPGRPNAAVVVERGAAERQPLLPPPLPGEAPTEEEPAVPPVPPPDTKGKLHLSLQGQGGLGLWSAPVGTSSDKKELNLSGGGGIGIQAGMGYGLSSVYDLDFDLGIQLSQQNFAADNINSDFTRSFLLATIKHKTPFWDRGQFKVGVGGGLYFGGKAKVDSSDTGRHIEVGYKTAQGVHVTGEFEVFFLRNTSVHFGAKAYFVSYEARWATDHGNPVPLDTVNSKLRRLDGSGIDLLMGINKYF